MAWQWLIMFGCHCGGRSFGFPPIHFFSSQIAGSRVLHAFFLHIWVLLRLYQIQ
jgi:hypothetical protein